MPSTYLQHSQEKNKEKAYEDSNFLMSGLL